MRSKLYGVQIHGGIGFMLNSDGSRTADFLFRQYTLKKSPGGWQCDGNVFRTLRDAARFIIDNS